MGHQNWWQHWVRLGAIVPLSDLHFNGADRLELLSLQRRHIGAIPPYLTRWGHFNIQSNAISGIYWKHPCPWTLAWIGFNNDCWLMCQVFFTYIDTTVGRVIMTRLWSYFHTECLTLYDSTFSAKISVMSVTCTTLCCGNLYRHGKKICPFHSG